MYTTTTTTTTTITFPVLTPVEERNLRVAFFGLSFYKNGRHGDELGVRNTFADDEMDVEPAATISLKRSAPDNDNMDVDTPPFKRAKIPLLCHSPFVSPTRPATITVTELVVVVNAYDGLSDGQKAGLDAWNARCNDGHLSQHAPAAVRAPVVVKIIELTHKPYEKLDAKAKRAWDTWNARCEAEGRSFFARSDKALGKRCALVDITNAGSSSGRKGPKNLEEQGKA
ncbi:hypothetical protein C8R46DRAFT_1040433 [Mycena filopes]|nr:hypothetical protein C8R46DRAFT_1040433 [Mycena filopes]